MVDERYEKAKKRVEEIKGFYTHAIVYVVINTGLFLLNLLTSPGAWWFYWPLLGWGIGLFFHGMGVFVFNRFPGRQWEERKIKEEMERMDKEDKK
jgi:hypothetical protein